MIQCLPMRAIISEDACEISQRMARTYLRAKTRYGRKVGLPPRLHLTAQGRADRCKDCERFKLKGPLWNHCIRYNCGLPQHKDKLCRTHYEREQAEKKELAEVLKARGEGKPPRARRKTPAAAPKVVAEAAPAAVKPAPGKPGRHKRKPGDMVKVKDRDEIHRLVKEMKERRKAKSGGR